MVLPASSPADAPAHALEGWIKGITRYLDRTDRGILLLVDRAQPWRLEALLRHLVDVYGDVEVYTEASAMATVPAGSTVVLVPRAEDAEALNMARSLFSRHELRVVLFCERPVSEALRRDAPDFFDWISLVVECPETHPPHIVVAIDTAISIGLTAIAWSSDAPDAMRTMQTVFEDVLHVQTFSEIDLHSPLRSIIKTVARAKRTWLCAYANQPLLLRRFRWALSAARRRHGVVVVAPERMRIAAYEAGFFPVHAATLSMAEARRRLAAIGAKTPGRLATWLRCEPDAVNLAVQLIAAGEDEKYLEHAVRSTANPCALLGRWAREKKITLENSPINYSPIHSWAVDVSPGQNALRAFEIGDGDAGQYFLERWLRSPERHDNDLRERLAEWTDIKRNEDIERVRRKKISGPAWMIPFDAMQMGAGVYVVVEPGQREQRILLDQLGALLEPDDQLLLKRYIADMDFADIAAVMGISGRTVRKRFARIVEKLRELVAEGQYAPHPLTP